MLTALTRSSVFVPIVLLFVGLGFLPSALAQRPATHPSLQDAALPPLIPAEDFFADQSRSWNYRVSPDGRRLVWIAYVDGKPTLHLRELDGSAPRIIEAEKPVYRAYWAYDNRHLVFYWDNDGDVHALHRYPYLQVHVRSYCMSSFLVGMEKGRKRQLTNQRPSILYLMRYFPSNWTSRT